MGKEWYWQAKEEKEPNTTGCMSSILHLLDYHNLLFTTSGRATPTPESPSHAKQASPQLKGVEAPRNSLDMDFKTTASSSVIGEEEFFDIPLGIQVVPASSELMEERRSSQSGTPRTPSLVARLMGLEVIPDLQPSTPLLMVEPQVFNPLRTSKVKKKCVVEQREYTPPARQPLQPRNTDILDDPRSLPETPRPSLVRSWEADPRLSLQNNKENNHHHYHYNNSRAMQEFSYLCEVYNSTTYCSLPTSPPPRLMKSRRRDCKLRQDENKNPHGIHYSEIVKQAKENISSSNRRVMSRDEPVIRSRRPTRPPEKKHEPMRELKSPPPSQETDTQKQPLAQKNSRSQLKVKDDRVKAKGAIKVKPNYERYTKRIKKKPASSPERVTATQSQLYRLDQKRCKPIPLLVAAQQHNEAPRRSLPPRPVQEQVQTSAFSTLKSQQRWHQPKDQNPELRYVRAILEHADLMSTSNVLHSIKWHSPSLPLNTNIFLKLELNLPRITNSSYHYASQESLGSLRHRCNRRLLFHLVQEILADILLSTGGGEALLLRLWCKIRSFPAADCRAVGDIDKLVEGDLPEAKVRELLRHPAVVVEAEGVVVEMERSILESLVGEVVMCLGFGRGCRTRGWRWV